MTKNSAPKFVSLHEVIAADSRRIDEELEHVTGIFDVAPELQSGLSDRKTLIDTTSASIPGNDLGNAVLRASQQYNGASLNHSAVNATIKAQSE